jgi:hypothetical protein
LQATELGLRVLIVGFTSQASRGSISMVKSDFLSYSEIQRRWHTHYLRQYEIPIEHFVSLPLPTKRLGSPGYIGFAAPAVRHPQTPLKVASPDRWWIISATSGRLMLYALQTACSFAPDQEWQIVQIDTPQLSVAEREAGLSTLVNFLDALAIDFFTATHSNNSTRKACLEVLKTYIGSSLLPRFRALTPDFFTWLEENYE